MLLFKYMQFVRETIGISLAMYVILMTLVFFTWISSIAAEILSVLRINFMIGYDHGDFQKTFYCSSDLFREYALPILYYIQ